MAKNSTYQERENKLDLFDVITIHKVKGTSCLSCNSVKLQDLVVQSTSEIHLRMNYRKML